MHALDSRLVWNWASHSACSSGVSIGARTCGLKAAQAILVRVYCTGGGGVSESGKIVGYFRQLRYIVAATQIAVTGNSGLGMCRCR